MKTKRQLIVIGSVILATIFMVWHVSYAIWIPNCWGTGAGSETINSANNRYLFLFQSPDVEFYTQLDSAYLDIVANSSSGSASVQTTLHRVTIVNGSPVLGVALRTSTRTLPSFFTGSQTLNTYSCINVTLTPEFKWDFTDYILAPDNLYGLLVQQTGGTNNRIVINRGLFGTGSRLGTDPVNSSVHDYYKSTNSGSTWTLQSTTIPLNIFGTGTGTIPPSPTPVPAERAVRSFADSLGYSDVDSQFLFGLLAVALTVIVMLGIGAGFLIAGCTGALMFLAFVGNTFIPDELLITILVVAGLILAVLIASKLKPSGND